MGDLEAKVQLLPVLESSVSGRVAPFALYFPSGFSPSKENGCKWELQATDDPNTDHYIIGRMVPTLLPLHSLRWLLLTTSLHTQGDSTYTLPS